MEALTGRQLHNRLSQAEQCGYVDNEGKRCNNTAQVSKNRTNVPEKRCIEHLHSVRISNRGIDAETMGILRSLGMI